MAKQNTGDVQQRIELLKLLDKENQGLREKLRTNIGNLELIEKQKVLSEIITNNQIIENEHLQLKNDYESNSINLTKKQKDQLGVIEKKQSNITSSVYGEKTGREQITKLLENTNKLLQSGWQFLMQSDKVIKSTILNLGMSGLKADMMRASFEGSAAYVARLGGDLGDVQNIMQGYADETGRARVLSASMVQDIYAIGKGTGLGVEQATRLGAQFELMGYDAKSTMQYVQGVVDTSERMGVNTTKVLKNVSDNFKSLNKLNFQQGVKGYAQMAMYSEKMKIDMNQALNSVETARTLEGAIGLAAQLQVMGGEFAKTDPFELLFLSRNDPAKFTEKINEMTKGVVTFRKMSDGTFEKFISPADRDRLASVEKSLGMQSGELTNQALRMADIQKMRKQMQGMGLSEEQKKLIEGAAIFDNQSGKFQVQIAGHMKDVATLTSTQANAFESEKKSLEERAKNSQTFDEAFKATIEELKATLLPMLQGVNQVLTTVRPYVEKFTKWIGEMAKNNPTLLKAAGMFMTVGFLFKGFIPSLLSAGKSLLKGVGGLFSSGGGDGRGYKPRSRGGGRAIKGAGGAALGKGAGVGLAAVGIGAGIGMAAEGISKLADSMSKLTPEQAKSLETIATTLAITFPAAAIGLGLVATTAQAGAWGLLALGAAVVMVGGGIYLATTGIGNMAEGLSKLVESGKGAGDDMQNLAIGVGALSLAMLGFTAGAVGLFVFSNVMSTIAKHAGAIAQVGEGFKQINTVMSGNKEDYIAIANAIQSISKANISGSGMFSELSNLLKKPLKIEFDNKDVALNNNITLELDGNKIFNKTYNSRLAASIQQDTRGGKSNQ